MTNTWHDTDAVAEYVTGRMAPDSLDAFEEHILACATCREAIRTTAAARVAMRTTAAGRVAMRSAPATGHRALRAVWIGVPALAASLVIAALVREQSVSGRFGRVTPPTYEGVGFRGPGDSVAAMVDRGMEAYARADWPAAARVLAQAAQADSSSGVAFYLGVARLMAGDAKGALAALSRAREPRGNPFADDALLYSAKALVRLGRPDSALVLIRGAAADGPTGALIRAFGDSLSRR